ncbi:MAG: hypothetical protein KatS3mg115_1826 [Candidatus Poribacteria bacterium]|nr:MAG: hypothetical protein KatS3mg115_1826 [Candidatus Poribacteria bacterium]
MWRQEFFKLIYVGVAGAIGLIGGLAGCGEQSQARAPRARIEEARIAPFQVRVQESGQLEALVTVEVKSNVEGEVVELNVEEGDTVQEGQVLLRIDDEQIQEEVRQAEANYEAALAQLERAKEDTEVTKRRLSSQLTQALESVQAARASLEAAKQQTLQSLSQAETDIKTAEDQLERDRIALNQAEIQLEQLRIRLNQLKSDLDASRVSYQNAEAELQRTQELYEKQFVTKKALEDAQQRFAQAQAAYQNAEQNVQSQEKAIEAQLASIEAQKRLIQSRETTLEFLRANYETLKATRAAAERQAQANLASAEARLKEIQETMDAEIRMAEHSVKSAEASLLRAESALETARQRLEWTVVRAPMSGTVTTLDIEVGEIITSGRSAFSSGPALMTIADLSRMIVRVPINEVDMGQVAVGQRAEIAPSAFPEKKFPGRVRAIAPSGQISENIVRFQVEVEVLGNPQELMPGMSADVDIYTVEKERALQVPIEAVQEERSFAILIELEPEEQQGLSVGQQVEIETRLGRKVPARVSAVGKPVRLTLLGDPRGWRPGPVDFSLTLPDGRALRSLSGRVVNRSPISLRFQRARSVRTARFLR